MTADPDLPGVPDRGESLYRRAFLEATTGMLLTAPDGSLIDVNPAFAELFGFTLEDFPRGPSLASPVPGSGLATGAESRFERSYTTRDGRTIWAAVTTKMVRDASGSPLFHVTTVQDLSAQHEAEEALRTSERRYRGIFENALEGIFQSTPQGRYLTVNPAAARMLGYASPEEMIQEVRDIGTQLWIDPSARPAWIETLARKGEVAGHEIQLRRKDGSVAWLRENLRAIRDADAEMTVLEGMFEDITERRATEEALRTSEARFRALSDAAWEGIFIHEGGRILEANRASLAIIGLPREAVIGRSVLDFVPADRRTQVIERLRTVSDAPYEMTLERRDGARLEVEIQPRDIVFHDRTVRVVALRDVTQRKKIEEQLRHAQKMEAVGQLAGGVAHDFNNLLTVINGYVELLRLEGVGGGAALTHGLDEIGRAGARAASLTRQLLAFSRRQVLEPRVLDLNEVIRQMHAMLGRLIGEEVELVSDLSPALGLVLADPGQIEQVLANLVVNARDAMSPGGRVTIETRDVAIETSPEGGPAGAHVMLAVHDTGTGMDAATMAHLFEPFFTTKEQGRGTGLGLATVYGIVKQSGGHVRVESEPGRGSTFRVYFPRVESRDQVPAASTPTPAPEPANETILVVEDEPSLRRLAGAVLRAQGYAVVEASDSRSALELLDRPAAVVHVLLTDVVMPGMSGPELVARARSRRPGLRVVYMSGYSDARVRQPEIFADGAGFLEKPFRSRELVAKIREVLGA